MFFDSVWHSYIYSVDDKGFICSDRPREYSKGDTEIIIYEADDISLRSLYEKYKDKRLSFTLYGLIPKPDKKKGKVVGKRKRKDIEEEREDLSFLDNLDDEDILWVEFLFDNGLSENSKFRVKLHK